MLTYAIVITLIVGMFLGASLLFAAFILMERRESQKMDRLNNLDVPPFMKTEGPILVPHSQH